MKMLGDIVLRGLELVVTLLLAAMVVMVFGNVVLRYVFNSGFHYSDELSRFAFVWLTFLGAVLTFHDNAHVNVESLVVRLGRRGRLVCMAATQVIILLCSGVMLAGTFGLHPFNATMTSPVARVPMSWVSDICAVSATGFILIAAIRLLRILLGRTREEEIEAFVGNSSPEGHL